MHIDTPEPYIYADNAATTPLSPTALDAMAPLSAASFGNPSGIHRVAREARLALEDARARVATMLGAETPSEIYFTSGGSESDNWVLRGAVQRFRDLYGKRATPRIVTSAIEHHAILHCCEALEREGVEVTYLPVDACGFVRTEDLDAALIENERADGAQSSVEPGDPHAPTTSLVSIMLANNEVGTIEPIRKLAAVAHAHGVPFHTDAVQAVGHIAVDMRELGVDALSLSAHKFHGPRGVGALYLREGFSIPPLIAGGAQERGIRAGTENVAGIVGMTAALEEAMCGLGARAHRVAAARDELVRHTLAACENVRLTGAPIAEGLDTRLPSIASFTCDNVDGELLVVLLDRAGVAAATGSACSTGSTEPSHVLTAMGINSARAKGALRLSLPDTISDSELEALKQRVPTAISRARLIGGIA